MNKEDKFIILASDGVWEFLSNEEVAAIVWPFFDKRNAEGAAEALVRESYMRWKQEEDDIIDDITCVIIFLDVKLPMLPHAHPLSATQKQPGKQIPETVIEEDEEMQKTQ